MARIGFREEQAIFARRRPGLRAKLLILLLAFGALPPAVAIPLGYRAGRITVTRQAAAALRQLARGEAVHLATELSRERLLLRTIAGQLPPSGTWERTPPTELARLLVQGLPNGSVFDGLRIVTTDGAVVASVALRNTVPDWPSRAPAADWSHENVVLHRDASRTLAYLVAVPLRDAGRDAWLEGHVRSEDFRRVFAVPEHVIEGGESAILDRNGDIVLATNERTVARLGLSRARLAPDSVVTLEDSLGGRASLVTISPIPDTDWTFEAALPLQVALAPLARIRNAIVLGSILLVVLIVLTAAFAAGSVTTPLRQLAAAAQQLGRTGLHRPIPVRGSDEVASLVEAFNRMAGDLDRSRLEIDHLHAQELERAQQLASVGELASGVAHEIRNPLTGVLGALDLALQRLPSTDAARPLLEEAALQLQRIESTTRQLLRYARPPVLREVVVDANELVEQAARLVAPQARAAGVTLRTEPAPAVARVHADPALMVQVLVNLLLNGVEAMPSGGDLLVWVSQHAPEVWIGVRDTGPGVPAGQRAEIYRPFFTTKHTGTGLGLSISRQIVERHGGSLRLEDTPGGGATFVVALKLTSVAGDEP